MPKGYRGKHMDSQNVVSNAVLHLATIPLGNIADVLLPDGTNVNQELVTHGWCWWYRKYAPGDTVLEGLETEAREAKRGVWADPQPVPPWEWRQSK
jgi:endonuclease YncB( thermonuclease family)